MARIDKVNEHPFIKTMQNNFYLQGMHTAAFVHLPSYAKKLKPEERWARLPNTMGPVYIYHRSSQTLELVLESCS